MLLGSLTLLAGCAGGPAVVAAVDVGVGAVALAEDGRTGTLGVTDPLHPEGDWDRIAVHRNTVCALEPGGRPDCWANGDETLMAGVPAGPFTSFDLADGAGLFLFEDGSVFHWPQQDHPLPTDGPWLDLAAVGASELTHPGSCGVDEAGKLWCAEADTAAPGGPWAEVDRTGGVLCARETAGPITCFELVDGGWAQTGGIDGDFKAVSTGGGGGVCALDGAGTVTCDAVALDEASDAADWASFAPSGAGHTSLSLSSDGTWGCTVQDGAPVCFGAPGAVPGGSWHW
jgi:hypothetical protein